MPLTLHVATTNPGKLRDFATAAEQHAGEVEFLSLRGMEDIEPPPENGATFEENARSKAIEYSRHAPGCIVLADDSGLEVDALHGAPGVRSARYAADAGFAPDLLGTETDDTRNNLLLLKNMSGVAKDQRGARYRCVLAAARDGECIAVGDGAVEGTILDAPRGRGGFGYDPLFYLPELGQTMAEISLEQKHPISHRGNALRSLLAQIIPSNLEAL
ncbi:MAG: non-canonical purine NTP pyrophosphatase [Acidobacteriaceae bacterium]